MLLGACGVSINPYFMEGNHMKLLKILFCLVTIVISTGCASSMMLPAEKKEAPSQGKALVTFFRPSSFGGAVDFGIWDKDKFLGILDPKAYIQYETEPGEHVFMARAENWAYVKADLEANKHYYVIAKVMMGVWKARVSLDPVKKENKDDARVASWLKAHRPTKIDPMKKDAYVTRHMRDAQKGVELYTSGKAKYYELEPEDGR